MTQLHTPQPLTSTPRSESIPPCELNISGIQGSACRQIFPTNSPTKTPNTALSPQNRPVSTAIENNSSSNYHQAIWANAAEHLGIANLKPFQLQAAKFALEGNNVVVVQPTGSGKSVCMILPSLVTKKTSIIIVPTVALIHHHLQYFEQLKIAATGFGGINDLAGNRESERKLLNGEVLFALMTPEYLTVNAGRIELLKHLQSQKVLQMVAFDEAHCAFHWRRFRNAYEKIESLKNHLNLPFMLLTATARPKTVQLLSDRYLSSSRQLVSLIGTVDRSNIKLCVQKVDMYFRVPNIEDKLDSTQQLDETWNENIVTPICNQIGKEKAIIYIDNTEIVDYLTGLFLQRGLTVISIKGGENQSKSDRAIAMQAWKEGNVQLVVATCSFGLGVNRPDIRFVFRLDYTATLEEFIQQMGRAGRDGSFCQGVLMLPRASSMVKYYLKNQSKEDQDTISESFLDIWAFANTTLCRRQFILHRFDGSDAVQVCSDLGGAECDNCISTATKQEADGEILCALSAISELIELNGHHYGIAKVCGYIVGSAMKELKDIAKGAQFGSGKKFRHSA